MILKNHSPKIFGVHSLYPGQPSKRGNSITPEPEQ